VRARRLTTGDTKSSSTRARNIVRPPPDRCGILAIGTAVHEHVPVRLAQADFSRRHPS